MSAMLVRSSKRCPVCGGRPRNPDRHEEGCPREPPDTKELGSATRPVRGRRIITEYRCKAGHQFRQNLPRRRAFCPWCRKRPVWAGRKERPPDLIGWAERQKENGRKVREAKKRNN